MENDDKGPFWRSISLWVLASICGAMLSWNVYINDRIGSIREEQIRNTAKIGEHESQLVKIATVGIDDRFRRQDFMRENEVWNFKFNALQRVCEQCCERTRMNIR